MDKKSRRLAALAAAGAATAAAGLAWLCHRYDIHPIRTMSGPAAVYTVAGDVRVLRAGGVFQSATHLDGRRFEPVFEYYRCFDAMFAAETPLASSFGHGMTEVLMLGGGGFAYPKHLLTSRFGVMLDVVEIDPAVIAAARRWFFVDELEARLADPADLRGNRMRVFAADARSFIERADEPFELSLSSSAPGSKGAAIRARGFERYNAIVNDCFSGSEPVADLATLDAAHAIRRRLVPGGLYLANVVSQGDGSDLSFLRDVVATLKLVFLNVHVVPCSDERFGGEDNYLVIATDSEAVFPGAVPYDDDFLGVPLVD